MKLNDQMKGARNEIGKNTSESTTKTLRQAKNKFTQPEQRMSEEDTKN